MCFHLKTRLPPPHTCSNLFDFSAFLLLRKIVSKDSLSHQDFRTLVLPSRPSCFAHVVRAAATTVGGGQADQADLQLLFQLWMREEEEEEGKEEEWSWTMNPNIQQLKYICHQCGHQTTHSLLAAKESSRPISLHSSLDTINLAVNEKRRRKRKRKRKFFFIYNQLLFFIYNQLACRFTLSSADDSQEYEKLSGGSSSHMQTLDVRIKLTPSVVRETYGNFERREEEEVVGEGGDGRGAEKQIYDRIRVGKDWGRNMVNSDWRDSSESSFSSNSCSRASDGFAERNFFRLKMPLKCLNKVTNFFLFK